ncbi:hypothetical protein C8R48DRAFT_727752 [Suillus tomentosus]|nr:hypothetical protein C8R48DRAFT_727752 [Suillus tomentosus]
MYPILSRPGRAVVVVRARLKECDYPSLNAQAVVLIGCAKRSASLPSYGTCLVAIAVLFALKTLHVLAKRCQKQRGAMTVRGRREWNREMISNQLRLRAVLRLLDSNDGPFRVAEHASRAVWIKDISCLC